MCNLAQAIQFAYLSHGNQRRKYSDEPYINHPVRVMQAVACDRIMGGREDIAMAAVLHDVLEDCDVEYLNVTVWGLRTVECVMELTNLYTKEAYPDWNRRLRKEMEFSRLSGVSLSAKVIKLYDRIDNLQSWYKPPLVWTDEMFRFGFVYARESLDLMTALAEPELSYLTAEAGSLAMKLLNDCEP